MFRWLSGDKGARELAAARAEVEQAQRALLPLQSGLAGPLAERVRAAELAWREARAAEQRGSNEDEARARRGYAAVAQELAAVRAEILARAPELGVAAFLAEAEELLAVLEDAHARDTAWLELLQTRLAAEDAAGAERMLAAAQAADALPASAALVRALFEAERDLGPARWLAAARARAAADLLALEPSTPEGAEARLELVLAHAEADDRAGARAALAGLDDDFRDQGLLALVESAARVGAPDDARAALAGIEGREARSWAEVALVEALARADGGGSTSLAAARALSGAARAQALIRVAAARARAGAREAALALVTELEESLHQEARQRIFEELLARDDLAAAEAVAETLEADAHDFGRGWVSALRLRAGDVSGAFAAAEEIGDPFARALALESLGWWRFDEGDPDGGRTAFAHALQLAGEVVRDPGQVQQGWLDLATRLQGALGDGASAAAHVARMGEPATRAACWVALGTACGRMRDFDASGALSASLAAPADRLWLLCGLARGAWLGLGPRGATRSESS